MSAAPDVDPDGAAVRPLWLVGTDERVAAQRAAWTSARFTPHALPWAQLVARLPGSQVLAALRYHRPSLVLLTSAASVAMLERGSAQGLRAACVGEATASAAQAAGFEVVLTGAGGSVTLAEAILALRPRPKRLLWLRAQEARGEGAQRLKESGCALDELVTYAAEPLAGFSAAVRSAPEPAAVLVESPRAVTALADALLEADRTLPRGCGLYGVGALAADRLRELGFVGAISVDPRDLRSFLAGLVG